MQPASPRRAELDDSHGELLVVRGGDIRRPNAVDLLVDRARKDQVKIRTEGLDFPGLSVFIGRPDDDERLTRLQIIGGIVQAGRVKQGKIKVTTVGALRTAGFRVMQTFLNLFHYTVLFPSGANESSVQAFRNCFEDPIPNEWRTS